jgi:hydroxymethylbilane synthase
MKDLPTKRPEELTIAAVLKRDSFHDILVSNGGSKLDDLHSGAVIGTSSMRRAAQLSRFRPDLKTQSLRGNLQTRLRKLSEGQFDAIILAMAGVERMGLTSDLMYQVLDQDHFVPSANQGTIVVVARKGTKGEAAASKIDDPGTRLETMVERRILEIVGGGCVVPVAVHADLIGERLRVVAEVLSIDGGRFVRIDETIPANEAQAGANDLGRRLVEMGGAELVAEAVRSGARKV